MASTPGDRGEFGVELAEVTLGLGKYCERREQPVRAGHLLAIQLPSAERFRAVLTLFRSSIQVSSAVVPSESSVRSFSRPRPRCVGTLRGAYTLDVVDSRPLRQQAFCQPPVEGRGSSSAAVGGR